LRPRLKRYLLRVAVAAVVLGLLVYVGWRLFEDPTNQMFGQAVVSGPSDMPMVALTYDDGPNPPYTDKILDVLKSEHVHATFFVVGRAVEEHPGTVKRMVSEGNAVGNHTWDHVHLLVLRRTAMRSEMRRTDDAILSAAHVHPKIMRPPFGARDWRVMDEMRRLGYAVIMWSVPLPRDWEYPSAQVIAHRIIPQVKDGSIIVLHDGNRGQLCAKRHLNPHVCDRNQDIEATRLILNALKAKGFSFVTVPELIARHKETKHKAVRGGE